MILRMLHWTISLVFWIAFALVVIGLLKTNRGSVSLRRDGEVRFVPRSWFVCAWVFIAVWFAFIGFGYLGAGLNQPLQFTTGVLICIGVVGLFFNLPGPIVAKVEALEETHWFWWKKKIRWTDIKEVHTEKRGSTVTVIGGRHKITYTNVYPDRARFLLEIKHHCANDLSPDFPNEPVSGDSLRASR